jgi:hypothetical protein
MQDDFDNGMGVPDEELAGETLSDVGDLGLDLEGEGELAAREPSGRHSGGARAKAVSPRKSSSVAAAAKTPARKLAKASAKTKKGSKKTARKAAGKPAKKAAKKSDKKKPAKKAAKKSRKAGRKK